MTPDARRLRPREAFFDEPHARASYVWLIRTVFDIDVEARDAAYGRDPTCLPFALFDGDVCVASVEVFALPLIVDGAGQSVAALRLVAVAPAWRGHGLFRQLMVRALAWCDAAIEGPVLLYAAEPALYERFGFRTVPQHRFVGPPPSPVVTAPARRLSIADDRLLIERLAAMRTPVSHQVAVAGATALLLSHLGDDDFALDYIPSADALVVTEAEDDRLALIDVVGKTLPSLAMILGALNLSPDLLAVMFPPDKIAWTGQPEPDETGLMIRGASLDAFGRPFMLPPTTGF